MKVDNTLQLMEMQLMVQLMKGSSKSDGAGFQMVLESLMNSMSGADGDLSNLTTGNYEAVNNLKQEVSTNAKSGNMSVDTAVDNAAKKYNVDRDLIMSVIKQESSFNPNAESSAGAQGLMQLMPGTAKELGVTNSFDVQQNVDGGTKYLKGLLDMYSNSKEMALAAYNAGPNAVKQRGMHNASEVYKMSSETKNYVQKIMTDYNKA